MTVIPAINEANFELVKKRLEKIWSFGASWAHIDVSDGKFSKHKSWNNPEELKVESRKSIKSKVNFEVHLMVANPEKVLHDWLRAGVKRIILHLEALDNLSTNLTAVKLVDKCHRAKAELMLAINPDTPAEKALGYKNEVDGFLVLAVEPGLSGQEFQESQLEKIKILKKMAPDKIIEVDGGINLENAAEIKKAGADILISASYIWNSENPLKAYELLTNI